MLENREYKEISYDKEADAVYVTFSAEQSPLPQISAFGISAR